MLVLHEPTVVLGLWLKEPDPFLAVPVAWQKQPWKNPFGLPCIPPACALVGDEELSVQDSCCWLSGPSCTSGLVRQTRGHSGIPQKRHVQVALTRNSL